MRDQADSAAESDFDAVAPRTRRQRNASGGGRLSCWPSSAGVSPAGWSSSGSAFGHAHESGLWWRGSQPLRWASPSLWPQGPDPTPRRPRVAACVSVANWVGATICVLVVRRRWLRPPELAEPVRWKTFYFPWSIDIAWEELTTALAPLGDTVTSEDFHTLLIKPQSCLVDVEFHMTLFPGATDATSALEVSRRHHWCFPFSGGRSSGWESLADLSRKTDNVVVQLGFMRLPPPPPLQDVASVLRTVEFRGPIPRVTTSSRWMSFLTPLRRRLTQVKRSLRNTCSSTSSASGGRATTSRRSMSFSRDWPQRRDGDSTHLLRSGYGPDDLAGLNHFAERFAVGVFTNEARVENMTRVAREGSHPAEWTDGSATFVVGAHSFMRRRD